MTTARVPPRVIELLGCAVRVAPWLLDESGRIIREAAPAHTYAVITDEHVGPLAGPQLIGSLRHHAPHARIILRSIVPGEQEKTRESWSRLTDWMLAERCGRDTTVIALGGGVVGDLAGFVAATFMRGVPCVQVPTSLLAMVDASVGGKVGVDTRHGKNLVGAFHQPAAVIIDPTVLQTLPPAHLRAGLAEVMKHGVIADASYFEASRRVGQRLVEGPPEAVEWHGEDLTELVATSVRIKADVVSRDEHERGGRQVLNYGHTVGHAIELLSNFEMLHGEAIAIGMCAEAMLAESEGVAQAGVAAAVREALSQFGLPTRVPSGMSAGAILEAMRLDKKARAGALVFSLPSGIGAMAQPNEGIPVNDQSILEVLRQVAG